MNKAQKNNFGRSMVEMLTVLAVIGVLSIGAVWAVRKAFTVHKTNNLIDDVKMSGFVIMEGRFKNLSEEEEEFIPDFKRKTAYPFSAFKESEVTFAVVADQVEEKVCHEVIKRQVQWAEEIRPNGLDNICKAESNTVTFFFNTELSQVPVMDENTCRTNRDCPAAKPFCRSGYCTKCETGVLMRDGTCAECPDVGSYIIGITSKAYYCHMCGKNYFVNTSGVCFGCEGKGNAQNASREECARCPNRCWDASNQRCLKTTVDDALNNNGICNFNCPVGKFFGGNANGGYSCADCPTGNTVLPTKQATASNCHTCGENYMLGGANFCLTCTHVHSLAREASPDECKRCNNRYYDTSTGECLLCPAGKISAPDGLSCVSI